MKLLRDQNLSYRMLGELAPVFPGSSHAMRLELHKAEDRAIWLKCGNRSKWYVVNLLLKHRQQIEEFGRNPSLAVLEVY